MAAVATRAAGEGVGQLSGGRRWVLVTVSVLGALLTAGIIYGYSGILPALVLDVGAFRGACNEGEDVPCAAQMDLLNAAYTLSMVTNSACLLPVGAFLDAYGPRATTITGSLVFAAGLLALAMGGAYSHPPPGPPSSLALRPTHPLLPSLRPILRLPPSSHRPLVTPSWPLHPTPLHTDSEAPQQRSVLLANLSQPIRGRQGAWQVMVNASTHWGNVEQGGGGVAGGAGGVAGGAGGVARGGGAGGGVGVAGACFFAAFFLLALGGPFILTPMINFSELLPSASAVIIAAQSGAFDASAIVFFLFGLAVSRAHLSLPAVCLAYLVVPLALAAVAAAFFPDVPFGVIPTPEPRTTPPSASSSASLHPGPLTPLATPLLQSTAEGQSSEGQSGEDKRERGQERPAVDKRGGRSEGAGGEGGAMREGREGMTAGVGRGDEEEGLTGWVGGGTRRSGELERLYLLRLLAAAGSDGASAGSDGAAAAAAANRPGELETSDDAIPAGVSSCHVSLPSVAPHASMPSPSSLPIVVLHGRSSKCLPPPPDVYNSDVATQLSHPCKCAKAIQPQSAASAVEQRLIDAFNCVLPLGGCLSVPLAGWTIDSLGLPPAFAVTAALSLLSSLLLLLAPHIPLDAMLLGFTAYSIARAFIYSSMAALIAALFGFRNFGRLYGITRFIGAFAALLQYPLMSYGEVTMAGDFTVITAAFIACELAIAMLFPLYLTHTLFGFFWRPKQ
ncbi:hypothetical protein CLOM_g7968 [Closterium sp. NIES-68]|nr:hypothetical protein CLOM_g7968 [Closterium sp. NIES-68]